MIPRILRPGVSRTVWVGVLSALVGVLFLGYSHTQRVVYITAPSIERRNYVNCTTPGTGVRPGTANQSVVKDSAQTMLNTQVKVGGTVLKGASSGLTKSGKVKPAPPPLPDRDTPRPLVLGAKEPAPTICPPKLHFAKDLPKTALFSAPGCGNTWVRHLLQQATGIYTGAVYNDGSIRAKGFLGEGKKDGTVVAVKTHEAGARERSRFKRAILIYRVPQESAIAEFNRRRGGHVGSASKAMAKGHSENEVTSIIFRWRNTNRDWIMNFTAPLHVVFYDKLKTNLTSELRKMLDFLNWEVTDAQLQCVVKHSEGAFHRKSKNVTPANFFSAKQKADMDKFVPEINSYFEKRRKRGFELSMGG